MDNSRHRYWLCPNDEYYIRALFAPSPAMVDSLPNNQSSSLSSAEPEEWQQILQEYRSIQRNRFTYKPVSTLEYYQSLGLVPKAKEDENDINDHYKKMLKQSNEEKIFRDNLLQRRKQHRDEDSRLANGSNNNGNTLSNNKIKSSDGSNVLTLLASQYPFIICSAIAPFLNPQALARLSMTNKELLSALDGCDIRFDKVEDDQRNASSQFLAWLSRSKPRTIFLPTPPPDAQSLAEMNDISPSASSVAQNEIVSTSPGSPSGSDARSSPGKTRSGGIFQSIMGSKRPFLRVSNAAQNFFSTPFAKRERNDSSSSSDGLQSVDPPSNIGLQVSVAAPNISSISSISNPSKKMTKWRITGIHISTLDEWNQCSADPELQKSVEFITLKGDVVQALNGELPDVSTFSRLGSVELLGWANLTSLEVLARSAAHMHTLKIEYTRSLEDIKAISLCKKLRTFQIKWCPNIASIEPLGACAYLSELNLSGCKAKIESLSALNDSLELVMLNVHDLPNLKDIQAVKSLKNLQILDVSGCKMLADLSPISSLINLKELNLADNPSIKSLTFLQNHRKLKKLNVSKCLALSDVSALGDFGTSIEDLNLSCCPVLSDISSVRLLQRMTDLNLRLCQSLSDVSPVSHCRNLRRLNLSDCVNVVDIASFGKDMENLNYLILSDSSVNDISSLQLCPRLFRVDAARCKNLSEISCLPRFASLRNIELDGRFRSMEAELRMILPKLEIRFSVR